MTLTGTDAYGSWIDTGSNTTIATRANTEVEVHTARETDTGSNIPSGQTVVTFHPRGTAHRAANSPR